MSKRKFKTISLFSGGMGLDLGLERTGRFELLAVVEQEKTICKTIAHNQGRGLLPEKMRIYNTDIASLSPAQLMRELGIKRGELDLLVGGPPCQSFSTAGKRATIQDPRGTMLWEFLRFVKELSPRFFLMENVRGLVSAAVHHRPIHKRPERGGPPLRPSETSGSVIRLFASDLQELKPAYHMDCFEVNAVNYGAPQLRERALFIGNRFNTLVDFPNPTHGVLELDSEPSLFQKPQALKPWATLRDALRGLSDPEPELMDFSPRKKKYLALVPAGSNWRSLPLNLQKESMGSAFHAKGGRSGWWRRLTFDLPCPTLVTMPNHASTSLCHPELVRALSVREYARIQEFPDAWEFLGTPAEKYAQIGNAVPLRLGEVAGNVIAQHLDKLPQVKKYSKGEKQEDYRIVYVQSHVRTRQWYKDGTTHVWDADAQPAYAPARTVRRSRSM